MDSRSLSGWPSPDFFSLGKQDPATENVTVLTYDVLMNVSFSTIKCFVARVRKRAGKLGMIFNQLIRDHVHAIGERDDPEASIEEFKGPSGKGDSRGWHFTRDEVH
jgi:hypothetical protein